MTFSIRAYSTQNVYQNTETIFKGKCVQLIIIIQQGS